MPHNSATEQASAEVSAAEVIERPAMGSGEPVWQAEVVVSQSGDGGRTRTFTIRGPPRKTSEAAERDAKVLTDAAADGPKAVRTLANQMHRG